MPLLIHLKSKCIDKLKEFQNNSINNTNNDEKSQENNYSENEFSFLNQSIKNNKIKPHIHIILPQNGYKNLDYSSINNITKILKLLNPCLINLLKIHKEMEIEINDDTKQIPTRKMKQFSNLTKSLSL